MPQDPQQPVAAAARPAEPGRSARVRDWIISHDDRWSFIVLYVGLAVVLSIAISLFWLVVVVAAHFALELVRQRDGLGWSWPMLRRALWEIKLDVALVLFALALAIYMELVMGVAGLGSATRMGAQAAARAAGWTRAIRGVLLSVDDVAQVGRAVLTRRAGADEPRRGDSARRWGVGDHIAIWLGVACTLLIVLAPAITHHTWRSVSATLIEELQPYPGPLSPDADDPKWIPVI